MKVYELDEFVSRDFKSLLSSYFNDVQIQPKVGTRLFSGRHVIVSVNVAGIGVEMDGLNGIISTMDWSVGVRLSDETNYLFTYTKHVPGTTNAVFIWQTPTMLAGTFQSALVDFADEYGRAGVHGVLLEKQGTAARTAPASSPPDDPAP